MRRSKRPWNFSNVATEQLERECVGCTLTAREHRANLVLPVFAFMPSILPRLGFVASLITLLGVASLSANTLVYEPFNYPADTVLHGKNMGEGFNGPWTESGSQSDYDLIASESLSFPFLATAGNALLSRAPSTFGTDLFRQLATSVGGTPGTTLWVSFLIRKTSNGSASPQDDYFGLALYPSNPALPALFIGDTGESNLYSLGNAGSAGGQVASSVTSKVAANATLLVVKITFADGPETIELFVNPDPSQPAPTTANATKTDLNVPGIIALGILGGFDATWRADEIRIATTFAEVVPMPGKLANVSTRLNVGTDEDVLIGGFIISGNAPKKVIIRGLGPSLPQEIGPLQDPHLSLFRAGETQPMAQNDNWRSDQEAAIVATGIPPPDDRESALIRSLEPGAYTAVLSGVNQTTGVGLVEIYDLQAQPNTYMVNISTRGFVQAGDNVMIGGFIITGGVPQRVILRALGPSLNNQNVSNGLQDPMLQLRDRDGALVYENDQWQSDQEEEIRATGVAPSDEREAAMVRTLSPGSYTAILRGKNSGTGVGLFEAYGL